MLISLLSSIFLRAEKNKPQMPCDSRNLKPMLEVVVVSPWSSSNFAVPSAPAQEKLFIPSPLHSHTRPPCRRGSSEVGTRDVFLGPSVWGPFALSGWQTWGPVHPPSLRLCFWSPTGLLFWSALPIWTGGSLFLTTFIRWSAPLGPNRTLLSQQGACSFFPEAGLA